MGPASRARRGRGVAPTPCEHLTRVRGQDALFVLAEGHGAEGTGRAAACAAVLELEAAFAAGALRTAEDLVRARGAMAEQIESLRASPAHRDARVEVGLVVVGGSLAHVLVDAALEVLHVVRGRLSAPIAGGGAAAVRVGRGDALVLWSSAVRTVMESADVVPLMSMEPAAAVDRILALASARGARSERAAVVVMFGEDRGPQAVGAVAG